MSIRERLTQDLKDAMKGGDERRKTVIRGAMAAMKDDEQQQREKLVKQALKKYNVNRPAKQDEASLAEYNQQVTAALAAEKVEEQTALDDATQIAVIQRLVKQRQDSINEAEKAGRTDIADNEKAELAILMSYLPQQMSRAEVEAEARAVIAQVGATDPKDMGKVMGPLMGRLQGKADGKLVSEVVRSLLAGS